MLHPDIIGIYIPVPALITLINDYLSIEDFFILTWPMNKHLLRSRAGSSLQWTIFEWQKLIESEYFDLTWQDQFSAFILSRHKCLDFDPKIIHQLGPLLQ